MSHRSIRVLPFAVSTIFTAILSAQASVQEVGTISTHSFLGGKVTAYGGFVWPNMKGSLKIETNFLTNPAVEASAYTTRSTGGARASLPACQTRIRMNGTTRDSASASGLILVGASVPTHSLSSLATVTNVLPTGAGRSMTFGTTQVSLSTNYSASSTISANFRLGSIHEMDNAVLQVWAQGATTLQVISGSGVVGIVSDLNYGMHSARVDDAQHGPVVSEGTLSWIFGFAQLLESLTFSPNGSQILVNTTVNARSGNRRWYEYFEG